MPVGMAGWFKEQRSSSPHERCRVLSARRDHSSTRRIPATRIATITFNRPDQLNDPHHRCAPALRRPPLQGQRRRRRQGPGGPGSRRPPRYRSRPGRTDGKTSRGHCAARGVRTRRGRRRHHARSTRVAIAAGASLLHWYGEHEVRVPEPPGLQEDQHPRGQGVLLRLALLPGGRRRPRDLLRRRTLRTSCCFATSVTPRACGSGR